MISGHFKYLLLIVITALIANSFVIAEQTEKSTKTSVDSLAVLWTSGDPDVAEKVCFMYTHAAKKYNWFSEVVLIVWGPSSRLLAGDKTLQEKIKSMSEDGIKLKACVVCADSYGVSEDLRNLGIEVIPMGKPLTGYLKSGWKVLTF